MRDVRGLLGDRHAFAYAGALAIHVAMFALLTLWVPKELPRSPQQIPIELIELPPLPEVEIEVVEARAPAEVPEIIDEPPEPIAPEPDPDPVEDLNPPQAPLEQASADSQPEVVEAAPSRDEVRPPSSGVTLQAQAPDAAGNDADDAAARVTIEPQYVYEYDPFAEMAPSLIARVSRATNCSRVNRETRPDFCPSVDENDVFLAAIGADRPSAWEQASYDPVADLASAQSALGRFTARQVQHRPNGRAEVPAVDFHPVIIPDEECVAVPFGFGGPDGPNGTATPGVPDSQAVYCR